MEIRNLKNTPLNAIVTCLSESFANYFLPVPTGISYWEQRFNGARVNFELSFGCFENDELVGFIVHGIDYFNDRRVAFNTGTGVTSKYRGKQITQQIYNYALPRLKEHGIDLCMLEVIEQNEIARHVYEKIGFTNSGRLLSFQGTIQPPATSSEATVQEVSLADLEPEIKKKDHHYSWDNNLNGVKKLEQVHKYYRITAPGYQGYFIIHPGRNALIQAETSKDTKESYLDLLYHIQHILPTVKIINVHESRQDFIEAIKQAGLSGLVNQYEMRMTV